MITDDYGNQVSPPRPKTIYERLDDGDTRMAAIELDLAANTQATQELVKSVAGLIEFFSAFTGAAKALEMLGRMAKPMGYILGVLTGAVTLWLAVKAAIWGGGMR